MSKKANINILKLIELIKEQRPRWYIAKFFRTSKETIRKDIDIWLKDYPDILHMFYNKRRRNDHFTKIKNLKDQLFDGSKTIKEIAQILDRPEYSVRTDFYQMRRVNPNYKFKKVKQ